ncbi:hypothetical protein GCM10025868_07690 [Angustibacter aerolatus]|uniref:Exoribonuclease phosphorolytic domain-containing protein n=1 Tax=Angustibacter aerolatus TaxID=1162965 RepID=A0ABQ6JEF1_9ACTN|nr:hypothetical protein [Angustibacter aerolatus]GMA85519.1 hypothetical protein GCM10025868_07690 [Angustibacter aerolatus]
MEGPEIQFAEAVLDNGTHGKRTVRFETGRLAKQAAGSAVAYLDDDTMLLSATTAGKHPKDHFDFFPLTIDVEEKMYAAGKIPGSFFRREGRPSTDAILTCRLIDRPLRPRSSRACATRSRSSSRCWRSTPTTSTTCWPSTRRPSRRSLSGLPFSGPIGGVRVALIDGQWVAFPNHSQMERAVFDMVVAGRVVSTKDGDDVAIMMVEAEATENSWSLVQGGVAAPTEEVVAQGLEAAKPFIAEPVPRPGRAWPPAPPAPR